MFLAQLALSMVVWGVVIYRLFRSRNRLQSWAKGMSRGRRAVQAIGQLGGSIAILALGMFALAHGGLTSEGLSAWGWPLITLVGAAFIVLQTTGLVPLVLNAASPVTRQVYDSSDKKDALHP